MSADPEEIEFDEITIEKREVNWKGYTDPTLTIPGVEIPGAWGYRHMTHTEYMQFPAVNASLIKNATADGMYKTLTGPPRSSDALLTGTLADLATLTPEEGVDAWQEHLCLMEIPINPTSGKPYGPTSQKALPYVEAAKAAANGRPLVTPEKLQEHLGVVKELQAALAVNPLAMEALRDTWRQATAITWSKRWGCWVKSRVDFLPKNPHPVWKRILWDLKTTRLPATSLVKDCHKFKYFHQAMWYALVDAILMRNLFGAGAAICKTFGFLALSKANPKECRGAGAHTFAFPVDPELNGDAYYPALDIGWAEGTTGRVDMFLQSLREHVDTNPDPEDFAAIRRIWPQRENDEQATLLCSPPFTPKK